MHSKLVLVERREGAKIKGYTHIGTGNFNENTAGIYSDFSLFTANQQIADDARAVFEFLQTSYKHMDTRQLLVSPFNMRKSFEELIDAEIDNGTVGKCWGFNV